MLLRASVAGLCAVALGGCLGGGSTASSNAGPTIGGSVRTADCAGWREADPATRSNTIREIGGFAGGPVGSGGRDGATLPESKAYELFEGACKQDFAKHFKLYKLYSRAAAFQNRVPPDQ